MAAAKKEYDTLKTPKPKGVKVSAGDSSDQTDAETLQLMTQLKLLQQHTGLTIPSVSNAKFVVFTVKFAVIEGVENTRAE